MRLGVALRRFAIPGFIQSAYFLLCHKVAMSSRAEVEWSRLLHIGRHSQISSFVKIKSSQGPVTIGERTDIGCGVFIAGHVHGIEVGNDCLISPHVSIVGVNYRYDRPDIPIRQQGLVSGGPIRIGNDVWIGAGAVILDNCQIGDGAIIGPNAVVSGAIPPMAIVAGNPGKIIFTRR